MKKRILNLACRALVFLFVAGNSKLVFGATTAVDKTFYIAACSILDDNFEIVRGLSPDWLCLPMADGGWIAINETLRRFDKTGKVLWEKRGYYHHQLRKLNEDEFFTFSTELHMINGQKVKFDTVQKMKVKDGSIIKEFRTYRELYKAKKKNSVFTDRAFRQTGEDSIFFENAKLEFSHLNALHFYKDKIMVNDLENAAILLTNNLEYDSEVLHPDVNRPTMDPASHDFQIQPDESLLIFRNYYVETQTKLKTFKIYQFAGKKLTFEFPKQKKDFVEAGYSGSVQKIGTNYLVGFPNSDSKVQKSTVGLVSKDGKWIKRKEIAIRIQEIKVLPHKNFLKINEIR